MVQVDEPALREGLPLKQDRWESYLEWAVDSFRLSTAVAQPHTQIVTHLCYSDFQDILKVHRPHISVMLLWLLGFKRFCPGLHGLVRQLLWHSSAAFEWLMRVTVVSVVLWGYEL